MALGSGNVAIPSDEIGIIRGSVEGYATLASVASVLAPHLVSPSAGNQLTVQTISGVNYLYVAAPTLADSIDDNPARAGNAWAAGDQMAIAPVGAADEKADVDAYLADAVANATTFNTALTTLVQNYVSTNIGSIDSVDDNPARAGNAWAAGDQMAIAQVGAADEKADVDAYLADAVANATTFNTALTTLVQNYINTNIGAIDSIDDNPARAGNTWTAGDQIAVAQPGSPDEKLVAETWLADILNSSSVVRSSVSSVINGKAYDFIGTLDPTPAAFNGALWVDENTYPPLLKMWNGTAWIDVTATLTDGERVGPYVYRTGGIGAPGLFIPTKARPSDYLQHEFTVTPGSQFTFLFASTINNTTSPFAVDLTAFVNNTGIAAPATLVVEVQDATASWVVVGYIDVAAASAKKETFSVHVFNDSMSIAAGRLTNTATGTITSFMADYLRKAPYVDGVAAVTAGFPSDRLANYATTLYDITGYTNNLPVRVRRVAGLATPGVSVHAEAYEIDYFVGKERDIATPTRIDV